MGISIPKYIYGIVAIIIAALIFLFTVQLPFSEKLPELNKQHEQDASQLQVYEEAYANRVSLADNVSSMKAKYEKDSQDLFINATKSPQDIMAMISACKVTPTTYNVSEQTVDSKGRTSSSGDPLYSTNISLSFDTLDETQIATVLDYFEAQSEGAYYIDNISISAITKTETKEDAEESEAEESSKKSESSEQSSSGSINTLYFSGNYQVSVTLMLYYFLPTDQTPDAIKQAVEEASAAADGTATATTSTASDASGAESSAS